MIVKGIELSGVSPEVVPRFASFGEPANGLARSILDTVSFILLVGATLSVTAIIPFIDQWRIESVPPNASVSPDSEY